MNLHGSLLDGEPRGDFSRRYTLDRETSDLGLAWRQLSSDVLNRRFPAEELADQTAHRAALQPLLPGVHLPNTGDEGVRRHFFQDDRAGAEPHAVDDLIVIRR